MRWSIRARLTAWYSAVMVAVLAAATIAIAGEQARLGLRRLDGELARLEMTVEAVMRNEFGEGLDLEGAAHEASVEVMSPGLSVVLATPDETVLAAWGEALPTRWSPQPAEAASPTVRTMQLVGRGFRVNERYVDWNGHRYAIAVLASMAALDHQRAELLEALFTGIIVALAVAAIGGWIVGRQALQPLASMALQATSITEHDPSHRLRVPNERDELGRLASAFNALLDRLAAALLAQRRFMADASHQLRTPVSVLRTTAQVMLRRPHREELEYRESMTIVGEQSARLARLVNAMFLLARADAGGRPLRTEALYLDELVAECARAVGVIAAERGVRVSRTGKGELPFTGDEELLRDMIVNLLENAVRHTHAGGQVVAELERTTKAVVLKVQDEGPGIAPVDRDRIFERFVRVDSGSEGAGLGLPVARWVAEAHGGHLTLESTGPGGSCFTVTLPFRGHEADVLAGAS